MSTDLTANLENVRRRIANAAIRAGRNVEEVKLAAVSKTYPPEAVRAAIAGGVTIFGENKVQEAGEKIDALGRDAAEWHLIGHLQSNKARRAVELFDVIESVDSLELATRLERICDETGRGSLSVFVQVDLAGELTKSGVPETDLDVLAEYLKTCKRLRFDGLMALPPYFEDAEMTRPFFTRLRVLRDRLAASGSFDGSGHGELSMGMSHDLEVAVEEGATVVRVGTAIFGARG
jgi:pyridoxal phosphate enzyme (YggS family)